MYVKSDLLRSVNEPLIAKRYRIADAKLVYQRSGLAFVADPHAVGRHYERRLYFFLLTELIFLPIVKANLRIGHIRDVGHLRADKHKPVARLTLPFGVGYVKTRRLKFRIALGERDLPMRSVCGYGIAVRVFLDPRLACVGFWKFHNRELVILVYEISRREHYLGFVALTVSEHRFPHALGILHVALVGQSCTVPYVLDPNVERTFGMGG